MPGELTAAFLWAQLEEAQSITNKRIESWNYYHSLLEDLEFQGVIRRPIIPKECTHNAHMYYILLNKDLDRDMLLNKFKQHDINAVFHYVPLHDSVAGKRYGKTHGTMDITTSQSEKIIRLPLWCGIEKQQQDRVFSVISEFAHA